jgi:ferric-dicitrate binding protein FerR (iron transport regulator)
MGTTKDIREAVTKHADQTRDHDRELERAIREALVLAVGKRAADQAHRRAHSRAHGIRPRQLIHVSGHLAGYGMLLAYIWHQRRTPKDSTA